MKAKPMRARLIALSAIEIKGCPFRRGLNQLWRNQMLALPYRRQEYTTT